MSLKIQGKQSCKDEVRKVKERKELQISENIKTIEVRDDNRVHAKKKRKIQSISIAYQGGRAFKETTLKSETITGTIFPLFSKENVMTRYSTQMHKLKKQNQKQTNNKTRKRIDIIERIERVEIKKQNKIKQNQY